MAKAPEPESVKTRLKGHLSDEERVALYERMLKDTVERLRQVPGTDTFITYSCTGDGDSSEYFSRFGLPIFPQQGEGLGTRMLLALERVLEMGYSRAALVGADIPGLGPREVVEALGLLDFADAAFGPAADGGYYLVACKKPHPEVFMDVEWSTPDTLMQTLDRAADAGLKTALGPVLEDVDTVDDLRREGLL
ncbi:hypothetical protein LCGC14_1425520 [marine sediment metagenome]|uniref:Glycosyltransferase n=1 Tax=marine sediment metagenome TaxID=412755 RepID=A0A0F9JQ11_9ZZZZ